jgi:hypothetical protein
MYLKRRGVLALASMAAVAGTVGCALADWQPIQRYPDLAVEIFGPAFAKYRLAPVERLTTSLLGRSERSRHPQQQSSPILRTHPERG